MQHRHRRRIRRFVANPVERFFRPAEIDRGGIVRGIRCREFEPEHATASDTLDEAGGPVGRKAKVEEVVLGLPRGIRRARHRRAGLSLEGGAEIAPACLRLVERTEHQADSCRLRFA